MLSGFFGARSEAAHDDEIRRNDHDSADCPGYRIDQNQASERPCLWEDHEYPENPEKAGADDGQGGRHHGISHAPEGAPGNLVGACHEIEKAGEHHALKALIIAEGKSHSRIPSASRDRSPIFRR